MSNASYTMLDLRLGHVSVDVKECKILLVRCRDTGKFYLPKCRRDLDERLKHTALPEIFEGTRVGLSLDPVTIDHPIAVTKRIAVSNANRDGHLKMNVWFLSTEDSTIVPVEGSQQEKEEFDAVWKHVDKISSIMTFPEHRRIAHAAFAQAAVDAFRRGVTPPS